MGMDPAFLRSLGVDVDAATPARPPWVERPGPSPVREPTPAAPAPAPPAVALEVTVPLRAISALNGEARGKFRDRIGRPRREREAVLLALRAVCWSVPTWLPGPWLVTLVRRGGRGLSDEALPGSLKHTRDAVAFWLLGGRIGQMDDDERITWERRQEPGKLWAVVVRVERREV